MRHRTKHSAQRDKILEILQNTKIHPTADWVYEEIQHHIPNTSRATVYRNLNILLDNGLIREVFTPDEKRHFDANLETHYHFICQRCSSVIDVDKLIPSAVLKDIAEDVGHQIQRHTLQLHGICNDCLPEKIN